MASYLRPRRGTYAKATATLTGSASLKAGEVFFEYQSGGLGTKPGKIKLGKDGSTTYSSLAYFVDGVNCGNQYPNGWACTSSTTQAFSTTYSNILSSNPMSTCISAIKQLLINLSANVTSLNNDKVSKSGDTMTGDLVLSSNTSSSSNLLFKFDGSHDKKLRFGSAVSSLCDIRMPGNSGTLISDYSLNVNGLRLGWDYLISINATTTGTNYTLLNNHKFSEYGYLLFLCSDGDLTRNPSIIPRAMFDGSSSGVKSNIEIDYSNLQTLRWVSIRHTSDTQALIAAYANSMVAVHIIGLKIKVSS